MAGAEVDVRNFGGQGGYTPGMTFGPQGATFGQGQQQSVTQYVDQRLTEIRQVCNALIQNPVARTIGKHGLDLLDEAWNIEKGGGASLSSGYQGSQNR